MGDSSLLRRSLFARLIHYAVLLLPVAVLAVLAVRLNSSTLGIAAAIALTVPIFFAKAPNAWRPPTSGPVVLFYLIVLAAIWLSTRNTAELATFIGRGVLLIASVNVFAGQNKIDDSNTVKSLLAKLNDAKQAAQRGNKTAAINKLQERSEERRVGKECRSRWSPYH